MVEVVVVVVEEEVTDSDTALLPLLCPCVVLAAGGGGLPLTLREAVVEAEARIPLASMLEGQPRVDK